ncbi:MAG: glycosyltransferase family 39 protein [Candidatus Saccharibacteria bacterium]
MLKRLFKSKHTFLGVQIADWVLVAAALLAFSFVTLWTITKSSIWFDEAFGAYIIHFNFIDIARYTATDVHPPLYYWLLKSWSMLFGNTELALRSMSVLFGGVAIVLGYLLTNRLFGRKAARISLIFMMISPMFVRYGQEARMYTLVTTIALAATYTLTFAINTKKRLPWIIYGILVGLGMWTHYFSAIVWIAHWIWRADNIRRTTSKGKFVKTFFSKQWIMAHIVAIAVFIPWLPFCIYQLSVVQAFGFWIPPVTPDTMVNFMTNVIYYKDVGDVNGWLAAAFAIIVLALGMLAFRVYKSQNQAERQSYRLIMTLAFVPMILLFALSMPPLRSSFIDRYLITSTVGIALFIGVTLALGYRFIKPKWRIAVTVLIAGLMLIGVASVWQLGNYNKNTHSSNNTRQIIEAIAKKAGSKQPIIAATPWLFYEAVFYSTNNHPVYFIEPSEYKFGSLDMLKYNDQYKIKNISAFTKQNLIIWYVGYSSAGILESPYSNWKPLQEVLVNDSVNGKPAYKAIQYQIVNN